MVAVVRFPVPSADGRSSRPGPRIDRAARATSGAITIRSLPIPTYEFACKATDCGYSFEESQSFAADPLTHCPACLGETLGKVLHPPTILDATPRTIGSLAERNNTTLGRYKLDSLRHDQAERRVRGRGEMAASLPDGMSLPDARPEKPWWRPADAPNSDINKLTPEQKTNYVMTGDSNG